MIALIALVRKDLIVYLNDRRALMLHLLMPVVLAAFFGSLFGGASDTSSRRIEVGLVLLDQSDSGATIAAGLRSDSSLHVTELGEAAAREQVRHGKLPVAIVIPAGFGERARDALLRGREKPQLPLFYDPSQSAPLAMVKGLLTQQVMRMIEVKSAVNGANATNAASATAMSLPYTTHEQALSSGPKYNGYAHSFAGMGVQFILFMGIDMGIGILLAQRSGIWNRLLAAPVSLMTVLIGRMVSGALIAMGLMCAMFLCAMLIFKVEISNVAGFLGIVLCFSLMTATFGMLIAAFGKTPEAARGIAVFATLIMVMLGGAWIPSFVFPDWMQSATLVVPTRWAVDGFDAVTWRGLGMNVALESMAVQLGFALVFGSLAIWKFLRKQRR